MPMGRLREGRRFGEPRGRPRVTAAAAGHSRGTFAPTVPQVVDRVVKPRLAEAGVRSARAVGARRPALAGVCGHGGLGRLREGTFAPKSTSL